MLKKRINRALCEAWVILNPFLVETKGPILHANDILDLVSQKLGVNWHCIVGAVPCCTVRPDNPTFFVLAKGHEQIILFQRVSSTHLSRDVTQEQVQKEFLKACDKATEMWRKNPNKYTRPKEIQCRMAKKFGGYWLCIKGNSGRFELESASQRPFEVRATVGSAFFVAWLG